MFGFNFIFIVMFLDLAILMISAWRLNDINKTKWLAILIISPIFLDAVLFIILGPAHSSLLVLISPWTRIFSSLLMLYLSFKKGVNNYEINNKID